jgi:protein-S-isoprenylcysteine O-methyltransferase Ste14
MTTHWGIVAACWVVFWCYWGISGLRRHSPKRTVSATFTVLNGSLLYSGFALVLIRHIDVVPLSVRFVSGADWLEVAGTILVVLGCAFAIWSRWVLGANWSATVRINEGQRVIRSGPYAFVAHPIYSGIALAVLGTALVGGTVGNLLGFVLVIVSFWIKARMEEQLLLVEFGDEYAAYRRNVKFMIPFVL